MVACHGLIKAKRIKELASILSENPLAGSLEAKGIGGRKSLNLSTLLPGENTGCYIRLKCLLPLEKADQPPP